MGDFDTMQLSHGTKGVAHKTLGIITRRGRLFGQQTFAVNQKSQVAGSKIARLSLFITIGNYGLW